jgi:hypothetical protein
MTIQTNHTSDTLTPTSGSLAVAGTINAKNGLFINSQTVSTTCTVDVGYNAQSVGPITIASGQSVTVSSGSIWLVF